MVTPKNEGEEITNALFEEWGTGGFTRGPCPSVDGREAIKEMKKAGFPGWAEVEWAGFHVKFLVQKACQESLASKVKPLEVRKRHLVKGAFLWDPRFCANEEKQVILGDVDEYRELVAGEGKGGIGILIVNTVAHDDLDGDFRRWHEEYKGGSSEYTIEREAEGRPPRVRKTKYMITMVTGYYFDLSDLEKGVKEGWLRDNFQEGMRNWDNTPRKGKYLLSLYETPMKYRLFVKNFNIDPDEFKEEFPD